MQFAALPGAGISIHALREEGDDLQSRIGDEEDKFLSTPSARRATAYLQKRNKRQRISIHALREEGDRRRSRARACVC